MVSRVQDNAQGFLQALKLISPSRISGLDAYLLNYITFRRFSVVWKVANPFFGLERLFLDFETWEELFFGLGRIVWLGLKGSLCWIGGLWFECASRDQVSC